MNESEVKRAIIISELQMTSFARQGLSDVAEDAGGLKLEHFLEKELLVNITHHVLVPQHQGLRERAGQRRERFLAVDLVPQADHVHGGDANQHCPGGAPLAHLGVGVAWERRGSGVGEA